MVTWSSREQLLLLNYLLLEQWSDRIACATYYYIYLVQVVVALPTDVDAEVHTVTPENLCESRASNECDLDRPCRKSIAAFTADINVSCEPAACYVYATFVSRTCAVLITRDDNIFCAGRVNKQRY